MVFYVSRWLPCGFVSRDLVWLRLWENGYGLCVKRTSTLFSERYGYQKTYRIGFGWRLNVLQRGY
jgi:hypothetical protein